MRKRFFIFGALIIAIAWGIFVLHKSHSDISSINLAASYHSSRISRYATPVQVARVIDGDTIELIGGERLRYIGIDTPEEVDIRKPVQCFAKEASARNKELVEGKTITFYKDISDRDVYGRLLGFVYLPDGTFVNQSLIADGYAFAYPYKPDISHAREFRHTEDLARQHHLGLWGTCHVYVEPGGREQTNVLDK